MTAPELQVIKTSAAMVDIAADVYGVASIVIDGVSACVVTKPGGEKVRFESPRVPSQRSGSDS